MSITWKDGVTTLATASVIVLERAYFHEWTWPLVSSLRWVISGVLVLVAFSFVFSYVLDRAKETWSLTAWILASLSIALGGLGLVLNDSDYLVLLMISAVFFWLASIIRHITVPSATLKHTHA